MYGLGQISYSDLAYNHQNVDQDPGYEVHKGQSCLRVIRPHVAGVLPSEASRQYT